MQNSHVEVEIKLTLSKDALQKIFASDLMRRAIEPESKKERRLISSYYDTPDLAFKRQKIAYRVRDKGDGSFEATVKTLRSGGNGLSERLELNLPLAQDEAVLTGFKDLGLGFELTDIASSVEKLFTVNVMRTTYRIRFGGALAELALDSGVITAGNKTDNIDEVEIELLEGEKNALLQFVLELTQIAPVFVEKRSKFARGLALKGISANEETLSGKLAAEGNLRHAVFQAFNYRAGKLLEAQNLLLDRKNCADAARIIGRSLFYVHALSDYGGCFGRQGELAQSCAILEQWENALQRLQSAALLQKIWDKIKDRAHDKLKNNVLDKALTQEITAAQDGVHSLAARGTLTELAYLLTYWFSAYPWDNEEYLELHSTARCCLHDFQEALETDGDNGEKALLAAKIFCLTKSLPGKEWRKIADANKAQYQKYAASNDAELLWHLLGSLQRGSNSRVLNRDCGIVAGWLLRGGI